MLRGLHLHRRQLDHWIVLDGRLFTALVDVRPMLAGATAPIVETVDLTEHATLTIPAGVAHGFLSRTPSHLLYLVTNEYDGTDELGFAWDDPLASVPWPGEWSPPILSERDQRNPTLRDLVTHMLRTAR